MKIEGSRNSFKWGVTLLKELKTLVQIIQRTTSTNAFSWKTKVTVCVKGELEQKQIKEGFQNRQGEK
jgi:hypothetical protein